MRLAAERLESEGVMDLKSATERWMGACYDIMRNMIENDMTLDEVE